MRKQAEAHASTLHKGDAVTTQTDPRPSAGTALTVVSMDQFRRHKQATVQDAARPAGLAAIQHLPQPSPKRAKAKARSELDKQVDFYMDRAEVIAVSVPFIYVYVASSLGAASALM